MKPGLSLNRDLAIVAAASFVSVVGDTAALIALTLRLHAAGSGGWLIAALWLAGTVPMVVLSPLAGALVDRIDSRTAIAGSAIAQAVCAGALSVVHGTTETLVLTALLTAAGTLTGPATGALVPLTVPPDRVVNANAAMQTSSVLGSLLGPTVGGVLTGLSGSAAPLQLDAATFVVVAVAIFAVRTRRHPLAEDVATRGWLTGLTLLRTDVVLRPLFGFMTALMLVVGAVNVAEVFLFKDSLHSSDAVYGIASACWMAGMIAGSSLTPRLGASSTKLLSVMATAQLVVSLSLAVAGLSPVWPMAAVAFVAGGVGNGLINVASRTIVVNVVPDEQRGRVLGVMTGVMSAAAVVAYAVGGAVVSAAGPRATVVGCGLAGVAVAVAFALLNRRLRSAVSENRLTPSVPCGHGGSAAESDADRMAPRS